MSSDSDIAIAFKARREAGKAKKESNREYSTNLLAKNGIEFEQKNWGNHLIVTTSKGKVDFWPSTGKFIIRDTGKHGRGVRKIIAMCNSSTTL